MKPLILFAEDDEIVRLTVQRALEREGFLVLPAADAREAAAFWQEAQGIDALVTDVEMGDGPTGVELAEQLRREMPSLPVLIVSAYANGVQILREDGVAFLAKPFTASALVSRVRGLLAESVPSAKPAVA